MSKPTESARWLADVLERNQGYESETVSRFAIRLTALANSMLPSFITARIGPEDVVQSTFQSFFSRNEVGKFQFSESVDVWRLLASITYYKVKKAARFHQQQIRDAKRDHTESPLSNSEANQPTASSLAIMAESYQAIICQLPAKHQDVLQLRISGYSVEEIAEDLCISTRTVNRGLAMARRAAEKVLEQA